MANFDDLKKTDPIDEVAKRTLVVPAAPSVEKSGKKEEESATLAGYDLRTLVEWTKLDATDVSLPPGSETKNRVSVLILVTPTIIKTSGRDGVA